MLEAEGRPEDTCVNCKAAEATWKCIGCLGQPVLCTGCCRDLHRLAPFHRVKQWAGTFWAASWLINVGAEIHLGHKGQPCPRPRNWQTAYSAHEEDEEWEDMDDMDIPPAGEMTDGAQSCEALQVQTGAPNLTPGDEGQVVTMIDTSGIHRLVVRPCGCFSNADADDIQLLKMGFFPSSFTRIRTVFTFQVLDDYRRDNLVCNTTAYQYFKKLRRVTSSAFPHTVPVRQDIMLRSVLTITHPRIATGS
jgi:hypothetical protein